MDKTPRTEGEQEAVTPAPVPAQSSSADLSEAPADIKAALSSIPEPDVDIELVDTAIKTLNDDGRVGGYLVVFGDTYTRDLTQSPNPDGSKGEFFTKSTEFALDWYEKRPWLYHHALDGAVKMQAVGVIDKIEKDDVGLWAEAQINKRNKYATKVLDLVKAGKLSWSSGSVQHLVQKKANGEITAWPLIEGSSTPTPAEPRYTHLIPTKAAVTAYKAIGLPTERFDAQDSADDNGQETVASANAATKSVPAKQPIAPSSKKEADMDPEVLNAAVEAALAKRDAATAAIKAEDARIEARAQEIANAKVEELKKLPGAIKTLPNPAAIVPGAQPQRIEVGEDQRYASLSSEDMSFLTHVYSHVLAATPNPTQDNKLWGEARKFIMEARSDPDNKLQRQISAKALRETARKELPSSVLEFLPFKSLEAVDANRMDKNANDAAIKSQELDNTGQSGFGLDWVPTIWSQNLWRRVRISNPFAALMTTIEMPSNPYNLPIETTDPTAFSVGEATDATQLALNASNSITLSKIASAKQQMTAAKLGTRVGFSTELVEDSIIPILAIYRYQIQRTLENAVDDTIVNGDTAAGASTNVNLIDATPAAGTSYLAFNGLRKYALITNTAQLQDAGNAAPTLAQFRASRKLLLKSYAADLKNLVWVVGWETYMKMLPMPEFATWQNLGMAGSNVTGLLPNGTANQVGMATDGSSPIAPVGFIDGIPVYVSAQIGLSQSGNISAHGGELSTTGSNNVNGSAVLFHRSRWYLGYRRQISLDVFPQTIFSDTYQVFATVRCTIQSFDTQSAALLYNIAV